MFNSAIQKYLRHKASLNKYGLSSGFIKLIYSLWRPPLKTWIQPLPDPDIKQKNPRGHGYQTKNTYGTKWFLVMVRNGKLWYEMVMVQNTYGTKLQFCGTKW